MVSSREAVHMFESTPFDALMHRLAIVVLLLYAVSLP